MLPAVYRSFLGGECGGGDVETFRRGNDGVRHPQCGMGEIVCAAHGMGIACRQ